MRIKIVPLLKVSNINNAVIFYTKVLDFKLMYPEDTLNRYCTALKLGNEVILLSETDGTPRVPFYIYVDSVDVIFEKCTLRGLVTPQNENSPVHKAPINQTWGMREFYVTDADGNTLRFATPIAYK